jgi:hypothetical protein
VVPECSESDSGRAAVQLKPPFFGISRLLTMIRVFKGPYGSIADLRRVGEIQGYEFLDPPTEYRFLRAGVPISDWTAPISGFVSLLRTVAIDETVRTRGLDATNLAIETRGLAGSFILLVWPRE